MASFCEIIPSFITCALILTCSGDKVDLEVISPDHEFPPAMESTSKIPHDFGSETLNTNVDTLDNFLSYLKENNSPVTTLVELRSLLLAEKEEKVTLLTLVDEMKAELRGIKFLVKLQTEELQVHAEELSKVWHQVDEEREARIRLEKQLLSGPEGFTAERSNYEGGSNQENLGKSAEKRDDRIANKSNILCPCSPSKSMKELYGKVSGIHETVSSLKERLLQSRPTKAHKLENTISQKTFKNHTRKILKVLELLTNLTSFHQKVLLKTHKSAAKRVVLPDSLLPAVKDTNQLLGSLKILIKSKENGVATSQAKMAALQTSMEEIRSTIKKCNQIGDKMHKAMLEMRKRSSAKGASSTNNTRLKKDPAALKRLSGRIDTISDSIRAFNGTSIRKLLQSIPKNKAALSGALQSLKAKISTMRANLQRLKEGVLIKTTLHESRQPDGATAILFAKLNRVEKKLATELHSCPPSQANGDAKSENQLKSAQVKHLEADISLALSGISQKVDKMSHWIKDGLSLPKRDIMSSLSRINGKIDSLGALVKSKANASRTDTSNNFSKDWDVRIVSNLTYLNEMFLSQAELIEDTRSLLINSSILHISQDNDELRQSVRVADNELKIIMLTDQVSSLQDQIDRIHPNFASKSKKGPNELRKQLEEVKRTLPIMLNKAKEVMNWTHQLPKNHFDYLYDESVREGGNHAGSSILENNNSNGTIDKMAEPEKHGGSNYALISGEDSSTEYSNASQSAMPHDTGNGKLESQDQSNYPGRLNEKSSEAYVEESSNVAGSSSYEKYAKFNYPGLGDSPPMNEPVTMNGGTGSEEKYRKNDGLQESPFSPREDASPVTEGIADESIQSVTTALLYSSSDKSQENEVPQVDSNYLASEAYAPDKAAEYEDSQIGALNATPEASYGTDSTKGSAETESYYAPKSSYKEAQLADDAEEAATNNVQPEVAYQTENANEGVQTGSYMVAPQDPFINTEKALVNKVSGSEGSFTIEFEATANLSEDEQRGDAKESSQSTEAYFTTEKAPTSATFSSVSSYSAEIGGENEGLHSDSSKSEANYPESYYSSSTGYYTIAPVNQTSEPAEEETLVANRGSSYLGDEESNYAGIADAENRSRSNAVSGIINANEAEQKMKASSAGLGGYAKSTAGTLLESSNQPYSPQSPRKTLDLVQLQNLTTEPYNLTLSTPPRTDEPSGSFDIFIF